MAKSVIVLGGGMVGGFMARELARDGRFEVTLADRDPEALARSAARAPLRTREADLTEAATVSSLVAPFDLVVGAVPGWFGFRTVETVLRAGKNIVDISFFPEDPSPLAPLAKERGLTCILDCGVMPGLGGMLGMQFSRKLDSARRLLILVGGLPVERRWPTEYKAPFSPSDVIEEYVRPARFRQEGKIVVRPALSDPELVDLPGVGTLEAFNTDGLRTLLETMDLPDMKEKTMRWPGHIEKMRMLRELGFFGEEPIELRGGATVRPLDLTSKLLFAEWKLEPGMPELTVMRVEVEGEKNGRTVLLRSDILDRTDPVSGDSSMARTTGWPAVVASQLFLEGRLSNAGLVYSERLAENDSLFDDFLARLRAFGLAIRTEEIGC
jgi:saccharopine dehydrogenase-like NADP-dependent oxidoreductase